MNIEALILEYSRSRIRILRMYIEFGDNWIVHRYKHIEMSQNNLYAEYHPNIRWRVFYEVHRRSRHESSRDTANEEEFYLLSIFKRRENLQDTSGCSSVVFCEILTFADLIHFCSWVKKYTLVWSSVILYCLHCLELVEVWRR